MDTFTPTPAERAYAAGYNYGFPGRDCSHLKPGDVEQPPVVEPSDEFWRGVRAAERDGEHAGRYA